MSHHKPDPNKSVSLTIDGVPVTVPEGTMILEAARKANIKIPILCDHPDLCKRALCRICVVECDGRGKLAAACSNAVYEGASIVTNNHRLIDIRKTILELILVNHEQNCLHCVRNKNCELQSLAEELNIRDYEFHQTAEHAPPSVECETLVRDMNKCVKCARCVEECQEVQNIRAINTSHRSHEYGITTPYKQTLDESSCVFCGQCVSVCPVGAIYEYDQRAQIWESLYNRERLTIAQVSPAFVAMLNKEYSGIDEHIEGFGHKFLSAPITAGKLIAAIKRLGFDMVFDEDIAIKAHVSEQIIELEKRTARSDHSKKPKLPAITGCSEGVNRFIHNFYPELVDHILPSKSPSKLFADEIKKSYAAEEGVDLEQITTVSFVPCIAQKYRMSKRASSEYKNDYTLSAKELMRMIVFAGIDIDSIEEEIFNTYNVDLPSTDIEEKPQVVHGLSQAHKMMESIRRGECDAKWVEIHSCASDCC